MKWKVIKWSCEMHWNWNAIFELHIDSYFLMHAKSCMIPFCTLFTKYSGAVRTQGSLPSLTSWRDACSIKAAGTWGDVFSSPVVCMLPGEPTTWETTVCINDKPCRALAAFCSIGGTSPLTFIFVIYRGRNPFQESFGDAPVIRPRYSGSWQTFGDKWGQSHLSGKSRKVYSYLPSIWMNRQFDAEVASCASFGSLADLWPVCSMRFN